MTDTDLFSPAIFHANPVSARRQLDEKMALLPGVAMTLAEVGEDLSVEARAHVRATYGWAGWRAVARRLAAVATATAKRTQKRVFLGLRQQGVPVEEAKAMAEVSLLVEEAYNEVLILSEYVDRIEGFLEAGRTRRDMMSQLFQQQRHEDH